MIQTETRVIGADEYEVTQLPSGRGRKLLLRILRVVGPAIGELVRGGEPGIKLSDVTAEGLSAALQELAARLTEEDFEYTVREFGGATKVRVAGGKPLPLMDCIELHFAGNYGDMVRWIAFAMEVNFRSFFGVLGSLAEPLHRATPQPPSPQE